MTVRRNRNLLVVMTVVGAFLIAPYFLATNAHGNAISPKTVSGVIMDQDDNPLYGASVSVQIFGGYWPEQDYFRASESTISDSSGYYEVTFDPASWDPHNTIKVIATYNGFQQSRMVEANDDPFQTVNITIDLTIPEMSGVLGILAAAGCVVPILYYSRRRRG